MQNRICFKCINYRGELTCLAFPEGIPEEILLVQSQHKRPHKRQKNKIVFDEYKD